MLTIGDEILSGRTRDANMPHLAEALAAQRHRAARGAGGARRHRGDRRGGQRPARPLHHVFTSGGIGPTHDDITADAIAAAFGVAIDVREDARAILATHYANPEVDLNPARLRMARIPDGAALIDNPVSKAPGFTLGNVHVMAGVPSVFQAMVAGLLPRLTGGRPLLSESVRVERPEGDIAEPLGRSPRRIRASRSAATRSPSAAGPRPTWWRAARTPAALAAAVRDLRALAAG